MATERLLAEITAVRAALADVPALAAEYGIDGDVSERFAGEYEERLAILDASGDTEVGESVIRRERQYTRLRLGLLTSKRDAILRLRDEGRIDDIVLREIQRRLDVEEVRLSGREIAD